MGARHHVEPQYRVARQARGLGEGGGHLRLLEQVPQPDVPA
jgi:hypothetical protein